MPKLTRPEALHSMGISIDQLKAYDKELKTFLAQHAKKEKTGNNGSVPAEKKNKSKKKET